MTLNLITLATVKLELGLSTTASDTAITAMIPKVSADVRRILNTNYDKYYSAAFDDASDTISIYPRGGWGGGDGTVPDMVPGLQIGTVITNPNIPADTYITAFDPDTGLYTMSADSTAAGDYVYPTVTIGMWSTISKMIWYRIGKLSTSDVGDKRVSSESYGPVSKTYADSEINAKWNYPQQLIDDLGTPFVRVG